MAYNNPRQLLKLIQLLDDERNDLFIHIDKNADFPMNLLSTDACRWAGLYIVDRLPVLWAHYSQVAVELRLLECATARRTYRYYHLLSGMDLPLKTQDQIHSFFDKQDCEFISIVPHETPYNLKHVRATWPLLGFRRYRSSKAMKLISELYAELQLRTGRNRQKKVNTEQWHFFDGWQWFSITDAFARYVLELKPIIEKVFCKSKAPDELFLQTIVYQSPFKDKIADPTDLARSSMRFIDWKRGTPYTFQAEDFETLIHSPYMFARKFDERTDEKIIDRIYSYLIRGVETNDQ